MTTAEVNSSAIPAFPAFLFRPLPGDSYSKAEWSAAFLSIANSESIRPANPISLIKKIPALFKDEKSINTILSCEGISQKLLLRQIISRNKSGDDIEKLCKQLNVLFKKFKPDFLKIISPWQHVIRENISDLLNDIPHPVQVMNYLTKDKLTIDIFICPCVFLPVPQVGRYGEIKNNTISLFFGYPLSEDPGLYGITGQWLFGGATHHIIKIYLDTFWKPYISSPVGSADINKLFSAIPALKEKGISWLESHIVLLMKAMTGKFRKIPSDAFNFFAITHNLRLYNWFLDWQNNYPQDVNVPFSKRLSGLLKDLYNDKENVKLKICSNNLKIPPAINLIIHAYSRKKIQLVFPSVWSTKLIEDIRSNWRLLKPVTAIAGKEKPEIKNTFLNVYFNLSMKINNFTDTFYKSDPTSIKPDNNEIFIGVQKIKEIKEHWRIIIVTKNTAALTKLPLELLLGLTYSWVILKNNKPVRGRKLAIE